MQPFSFQMTDAILAVIPVLVAEMDTGVIVYATRPLEQMFGHQIPGELIDKTVEELVPTGLKVTHEEHRQRYAENPIFRTMGASFTLMGQRKDGSKFPTEVMLAPVIANKTRYVVAVVTDMTCRNGHAKEKI